MAFTESFYHCCRHTWACYLIQSSWLHNGAFPVTTAVLQKRTQRVHEVSNLPNITQQGNGGLDSVGVWCPPLQTTGTIPSESELNLTPTMPLKSPLTTGFVKCFCHCRISLLRTERDFFPSHKIKKTEDKRAATSLFQFLHLAGSCPLTLFQQPVLCCFVLFLSFHCQDRGLAGRPPNKGK